MLTYDAALARILAALPPVAPENVLLADALGRALAAETFASADLPPFDNSAVDGYAIDGTQPNIANNYPIVAEIAAGDTSPAPLSPGVAARIFTGAPVPAGADRIIMQEDSTRSDVGTVAFSTIGDAGQFIRKRGSDVTRETKVLSAGQTIDAGTIGLLAALNAASVSVYRPPRVALLTSGNEIVAVGDGDLRPGQIRDSNGPALAAALIEAGAEVVRRRHLPDTLAAVVEVLAECQDCDFIVSSGGVSVGDHDYVKAAVEMVGTLDFWRVAIRPGKPLAFGRVNGALFFGLPGNPVSSLVTFELFVRPTLRRFAGHRNITRPQVMAMLTTDLPHETGRREFVRAEVTWQNGVCLATPTGAQGSHRLSSLIGANAYLIAHEERGDYKAGQILPALLLL